MKASKKNIKIFKNRNKTNRNCINVRGAELLNTQLTKQIVLFLYFNCDHVTNERN